MHFATITGTVVSEVKVINISKGQPFARFTLENEGRKYNCLIANKIAYNFMFIVQQGSIIRIDAHINNRMQLNVASYELLNSPVIKWELGTVFNHKREKLDIITF